MPAFTVPASISGAAVGSLPLGPALVAWAPAQRQLGRDVLHAALSEADLQRAGELAPGHLRRFIAGRLLIHSQVAQLFPHAIGWTISAAPCRRCGNPHAGVQLEGVPASASVSYALDLVVVAVAPTSQVTRLGVDVESSIADNRRVEELRRMIGTSTEPILRRWTRVQAVLKADGRGLLIDPGAVHLRRGGAWIAGQSTSYVVAEVPGPPGFLISLAWSAATPAGTGPGQTGRRMAGAAGARWPAQRSR
jgi:4'-phosphopantetheinyl transferase